MKTLLLILLSTPLFYSILAQQPPGQSQYEMAVDLFNSEEYEDGFMILEIAISKQNTDAMTLKGDLHYKGKGVEQDYNEAYNWYHEASFLGNYNAMTKLGAMYSDSLVPESTYSDAVDLYTIIFKQGNNNASSFVGLAYLDGHGRVQNYDSAIVWFNKGAIENDLNCKYYLAKVKLNDNYKEALIELEDLCDLNYSEACALLGELFFEGELLSKDIAKAIEYVEKGIELNNARAHFVKAWMILENSIEGTKKEAIQMVDKAKKLGYSEQSCDFLKLQIYGEMH